MGSISQLLSRAAGFHRRAASLLLDAQAAAETLGDDQFAGAAVDIEVRRLAGRLQSLAVSGLPGMAGTSARFLGG